MYPVFTFSTEGYLSAKCLVHHNCSRSGLKERQKYNHRVSALDFWMGKPQHPRNSTYLLYRIEQRGGLLYTDKQGDTGVRLHGWIKETGIVISLGAVSIGE